MSTTNNTSVTLLNIGPVVLEICVGLCMRHYCYSFKTLQLMWSMEYNPNLFSMLESDTGVSRETTKDEGVLKQCGKFERKNLQAAKKDEIPLSIFVVASVLEARNKKLLVEAKGLDDVVKVLSLSLSQATDDDDDNDEWNL